MMEPTRSLRARRRSLSELLVLLSVPVILALLYYIAPISFQKLLVLDHTEPRIHALWTNAFVHEHRPGDTHVIGTILGYTILVLPTWALYKIRDEVRRFWYGLAMLLVIGPLVASLSSYIAFHEVLGLHIENDRGFSGVVGALDGFLIMSILSTVMNEQEESVARLSMGFYFSYLMLGFGAASSRIFVIAIGVVALGMTIIGTYTRFMAPVDELLAWGRTNRVFGVILVIAAVASALAFAASLPTDITNESGGLKNIVAHGAGIIFGMLVEITLRHT